MVNKALKNLKMAKPKVLPVALITIRSILSSIHRLSLFELIRGLAYIFENYFQS